MRIQNIQVLRALAACSVVIFHSITREGGHFEIGQAGVDIFFVISGFIMWSVASRNALPIPFLRDRIIRIVPLYWLVTLIMAVGSNLKLFPNLHATLGNLVCSLFFIPYMQDGVHIWPLLVPGWTLNYEMFFYVIFALCLNLSKSLNLIFLTGTFLLLTLIGLSIKPAGIAPSFYTSSLILEFIFGVYIAVLCESAPQWKAFPAIILIIAGLAGFTFVAISPLHMLRVFEWGAPAAILVLGAIRLEQAGYFTKNKYLIRIGDASYSIYLTHPIVISLGLKFLPHAFHGVAWLILTIISVAVGLVAYEVLEKRLIKLGQFFRKIQSTPTSMKALIAESK